MDTDGVRLLLSSPGLNINAVDASQFTAIDNLLTKDPDASYIEILELLLSHPNIQYDSIALTLFALELKQPDLLKNEFLKGKLVDSQFSCRVRKYINDNFNSFSPEQRAAFIKLCDDMDWRNLCLGNRNRNTNF